MDTNHNGSLSYGEIEAGLKELAKSQGYTPTEADWKWVEETGAKIDSKDPGVVDMKEFHAFANAVFEHFHLCHLIHDHDDHDDHDSGSDSGSDSDHDDHHDDGG